VAKKRPRKPAATLERQQSDLSSIRPDLAFEGEHDPYNPLRGVAHFHFERHRANAFVVTQLQVELDLHFLSSSDPF
jgi:hypothetical protein